MYSEEVKSFLEENGVETGDRVRVYVGDRDHEGILMPRSQQGDNSSLVIKLDNGYNVGIKWNEDVDIEVMEGSEREEREVEIPERDPEKMDIVVLHTGGTIASRVSYQKGGVRPAFEPEDLFEIYPEIFDMANVRSEVIAQMLSEDMEPRHWVQIAEAVAENRDADGIIIGHGTDTMHYTSAALSFMLENIDVPVVLVGAQRSSDRPSSDAYLNLTSAVRFIEEKVPGIFVCMHGSSSDDVVHVHRGTRVRKMHTSRRDAFRSIGERPLAEVDHESGEVKISRPVEDGGDFELRTEIDESVGLVKTRPGMTVGEMEGFSNYNGLVIEGTGLGHMPVNSFDEHTEHHEEILEILGEMAGDSVVAMSSQCINGRVNMNVYDAGVKIQERGVISAGDMLPEVAYVKLMWALGQAGSKEEAEELFQKNVAGEMREREEYDGF